MVHIFQFSLTHSLTHWRGTFPLSHRRLSPPAEVDVGDGGHAVRLEEPLHAAERQFCVGGRRDLAAFGLVADVEEAAAHLVPAVSSAWHGDGGQERSGDPGCEPLLSVVVLLLLIGLLPEPVDDAQLLADPATVGLVNELASPAAASEAATVVAKISGQRKSS